jgi:mono/diheme cytochrome c family protein
VNQLKYIGSVILLLIILSCCYFIILFLLPEKKKSEKVQENVRPESKIVAMSSVQSFGMNLYTTKCVVCHGFFSGKDGSYLILAGTATRWDEEKKLFEFIRNSDEYTKNNDYVQSTSVKKKSIGHKFQDLSDAEIRSVVEYIKYEFGEKYK